MLAASQPFNSLDFRNQMDSYEAYLEIQKEETLEDICYRPPVEYLRRRRNAICLSNSNEIITKSIFELYNSLN